jgi:hypothetical protein
MWGKTAQSFIGDGPAGPDYFKDGILSHRPHTSPKNTHLRRRISVMVVNQSMAISLVRQPTAHKINGCGIDAFSTEISAGETSINERHALGNGEIGHMAQLPCAELDPTIIDHLISNPAGDENFSFPQLPGYRRQGSFPGFIFLPSQRNHLHCFRGIDAKLDWSRSGAAGRRISHQRLGINQESIPAVDGSAEAPEHLAHLAF